MCPYTLPPLSSIRKKSLPYPRNIALNRYAFSLILQNKAIENNTLILKRMDANHTGSFKGRGGGRISENTSFSFYQIRSLRKGIHLALNMLDN